MKPPHILMIKFTLVCIGIIQWLFVILAFPHTLERASSLSLTSAEVFGIITSILSLGLLPSGMLGVGLQRWWGMVLLIVGNIVWFSWAGVSIDILTYLLKMKFFVV